MRVKIKTVDYNIYNDKNINKKIVLISDIHYYSKKDIIKLDKIYYNINKIAPDYICIAGDFIEQSYVKNSNYLVDWLSLLSKEYKIIMILGNHELTVYHSHEKIINYELLKTIKKIGNVYLLMNENVIIDDINFIGIKLPYEYYYKYNEDSDYLIKYINKLKVSIEQQKYNILLCHSPISILPSYDKIDIFKDINLSLYGHTHGGMMPYIFRKISKNRGIINSKMEILPKYSHGYIKDKNAIISTGITKLSPRNPLHKLNFLFNGEITTINITNRLQNHQNYSNIL